MSTEEKDIATQPKHENPFLLPYGTPHNTPPFGRFTLQDVEEAMLEGMRREDEEVEQMLADPAEPTFDNTLVRDHDDHPKDYYNLLGRVSGVFFNLLSAEGNEEMEALAQKMSPLLTKHANDISLNPRVFERLQKVKAHHRPLTPEEETLLRESYEAFVRSGALLDEVGKDRFRQLTEEASRLSLQFSQNLRKATKAFKLHLSDEADLSGLPEAAATAAREEGKEGWIITLDAPSYGPFMMYADRRDLRQQVFMAHGTLCTEGEECNLDICKRLVNLRRELAQLLGYETYADYVMEYRMASSAQNVYRLLDDLIEAYKPTAVQERAEVVALAKELEGMGADAICIKDMANLLLPMEAYSLVKALKETVSVPIHLHTHNTSGTGDMTLLMAAYAGVDIVDTALSPMANGTSQPATESLVATLQGTVRDTGLSLEKMSPVAAHFRKVAQRLQDAGILDPKVLRVDTNTLLYQVPGGMLSNLISQLKQAGKEDKYYDVLAEIPRVRKDFGYPPLVTPSSQIVGTQAVMNVIMGERYKTFPKESRAMLKGEYGKLPGEVNEEVRAKAGIAPEDVITCRPADLLEPELDKYRQEFKGLAKSDEDVLSLALFPQVAPKFIEKRDHPAAEAPAAPAAAPAKPADDNAVRELYVEWKN